MLNPNTEPQKVEAPATEAQPPKPKRPYEPPKAEVISFDNEYVWAAMGDGAVFTVMQRNGSGLGPGSGGPHSGGSNN